MPRHRDLTVIRRDAEPGDVIDLDAWADQYADFIVRLLVQHRAREAEAAEKRDAVRPERGKRRPLKRSA
jgi:hypothetical protein